MLPRLIPLACYVAAYRFLPHGVTLDDNLSFAIGWIVFLAAILLTVWAIDSGRHRE